MMHKTYRPAISIGTGLGEDKGLLHVPRDLRAEAGDQVAAYVEHVVRTKARAGGESLGDASRKPLCPGCTGLLLVNAALSLANKFEWEPHILRKIGRALVEISKTGQTHADYHAAKMEKLHAHGQRHLDELGVPMTYVPERPSPFMHYRKQDGSMIDGATRQPIEPVPSAELTQDERDAEQWGATFYRFKQPGHDGYEEA